MENPTQSQQSSAGIKLEKKDVYLSMLAGFLIGLLLLPILNAGKRDLYEKLKIAIIPLFTIITPLGLWIASLISKKISIIWQLAKFIVSGVLNTVINIGSLAFLSYFFKNSLGIDSENIMFLGIAFYSLYTAIAFILANINSYFWNKFWTFQKDQTNKAAVEFTQFFAVSIIGLLIYTITASYVFKNIHPLGGLNQSQWELIGGAIGSIAGLIWNFVGYKLWVFKK